MNECKLASKLRHPNIVQFLGVCYLPGSSLPVLLMEKLSTSLDELLEKEKNIPFDVKISILIGVSCGLVFLHCRDPPIAHRDLTARNILLDSSLAAKIADLGVARMVNIRPGKLAATMTQAPGNIIYMPPETLGKGGTQYSTAIDIFSFGNVALFTMTQVFQDELLAANFYDSKTRKLIARTEIERRSQYIDILYEKIGRECSLSKLVLQCLEYLPEDRPSATQVLDCLKEVRANTVQEWDMTKLELIHSVEQARNQPPSSEELQRQLAEKETEIDKRQALIEVKQVIINEHQALIDEKQATINEKQAALDGKQAIIDEMQATLEAIITENQRIVNEKKALVTQKDAIIIRKQSEIERLQDSKDKLQSDLKQKSIANLQAKLLQMKAVTTNDGDTEKASPLLDVTPGEKQLVGHSSENMKFPEPEPKKKPVEQVGVDIKSLLQ